MNPNSNSQFRFRAAVSLAAAAVVFLLFAAAGAFRSVSYMTATGIASRFAWGGFLASIATAAAAVAAVWLVRWPAVIAAARCHLKHIVSSTTTITPPCSDPLAAQLRPQSAPWWCSWGFLFAVNALFFTLVAWLLPVTFESNDDIAMLRIASGFYDNGQPNAHLVFINILYGYLVSGLYRLTTAVEWYTLLEIAIVAISSTVVAKCLLERRGVARYAFLAVFYLYALRFAIYLQFTEVAALAAMSGLCLVARGGRRGVISGVALFLLGALVRYPSAMMVGLISVPFFVLWGRSIGLRRALVPLAVCVVGAWGLQKVDRAVYAADPAWAHYRAYNAARGTLNDNPNVGKVRLQLPQGVTKADLTLFRWFFPDASVMTLDRIRDLQSQVRDVAFADKAKRFPDMLRGQLQGKLLPMLLFAALFFALAALLSRRGWAAAAPLLCAAAYVGVMFYISLDGHLKPRVVISAAVPFAVFLFYVADTGKRWLGWAMALLLLYPAWDRLDQNLALVEANRGRITSSIRHGDAVLSLGHPAPVVSVGTGGTVNALAASRKRYDTRNMGWLTGIPLAVSIKSHREFVDQGYLCVVNSKRAGRLKAIVAGIRRNHGIACQPRLLATKRGRQYWVIERAPEAE